MAMIEADAQLHSFVADRLEPGSCRMCGHPQRKPWHLGSEYHIAHDGFVGVVIGSYTTLEGKKGLVLQQNGTRVVHVYGEKWINE